MWNQGFLAAALAFAMGNPAKASDLPPEQRAFFETKIRPVLVKECYECHAQNAKKIGGKLRLDSKSDMLVGGESGPAMQPGKPQASLLIQALQHDGTEMPPKKKLPDHVIQDFVRWIQMGAPDPREENASKAGAGNSKTKRAELWSLRPIQDPPCPSSKGQPQWARTAIDQFVLDKMIPSGLKPGEDATPAVLIRRLSYALHGLPPTAEETERFLATYTLHGQEAVADLVDHLLASPRYGERWGRHWLDVARYAESNGDDGLGRNPNFPHAWRYRDYVIDSFNQDTPYDQFIREQLAGDLMEASSPEERDRGLVATGFLALCAKPAVAMNNANFPMDVVADQIGLVGSGILGISLGCARCHDHKHDPISLNDYTALAGIFKSTETLWGAAGLEPLSAPETPLHELKTAAWTLVPHETTLPQPTPPIKRRPASGKFKYTPGAPLAMGVRDAAEVSHSKVNIGGEASRLGAEIARGFPELFPARSGDYAMQCPPRSGRLELADWLVEDAQPLTARVMVNRVWQHLFGEGLIRTPDDFGDFGDRPVHPELLDHLATRFVRDSWSVKKLIRSIVLSRTYQLSSTKSDLAARVDPDNRLLSFHSRWRLDAESLRDTMLAASGQLNLTSPHGSLLQHQNVLINEMGNLHHPNSHRSVYQLLLRGSMPPELTAFNLPDALKVKGRRDETTLPSQTLYLLNNAFVAQQAHHLANRVLPQAASPPEMIRLMYRHALSRDPDSAEVQNAERFLAEMEKPLRASNPDPEAWTQKAYAAFCQALFTSNEFRYID